MPLILLLAAQAAAAAPEPAPAPAKPEKQMCRRMPAATGSIMPAKPMCHTKTEWAQIDEANRAHDARLRDTLNNGTRAGY